MKIIRYPSTNDRSLQAWSAADEYLLKYCNTESIDGKSILTYNDRFGFLNCHLQNNNPISVISYKSQRKSHKINLEKNGFVFDKTKFVSPLSNIDTKIDIVLMKIPKSLDLFELYLSQLSTCLKEDGVVYCSFMTRHFTKQLLTIANTYFEVIEQSLAWKKARVLTLKKKKEVDSKIYINELKLSENELFKQYYGVFSAKEIDYATQFLMENIQLNKDYSKILDLASGNGVLAYSIRKQLPKGNIHLLDDSFLAMESAKLNLDLEDRFFHYNDCLEDFAENSFDLVVSNPPFHFEYETNIEISLRLFKEAHFSLKEGGSFQLVANRHLNYKTHLKQLFKKVEMVSQNDKFEIYNCVK